MVRPAWLMTFALSALAQGAAVEDGLRIRALIDGADLIKISSSRLWYEHESFDLPGKWHGHDEPTFVNGEKWVPVWDGKTSGPFESAKALLPLGPGKRVQVDKVEVRGRAFVLEQPSEANDHTATIYLDDRFPEGGAWYEVIVRTSERSADAEAADADGPYAWQQTADYRPPHFESFFPDDPDGGKRLDAFAGRLRHDSRPDEEILGVVRNGLRRTTKNRSYILRDIGNRYVWGKAPQHPAAIEIMYHAADFGDQYGTRHYAVYFGLSVIRPPKPPAVLRTLAEICMMGQEVDRVTWGCKQQLDELEASAPAVSYVIVFGPRKPFDPKDGAELRRELEAELPEGVKAHDFGWRKKGDQIGGWIIVDQTSGRDTVKKVLSQSRRLALIQTALVTPQVQEHLRKQSQSTRVQ